MEQLHFHSWSLYSIFWNVWVYERNNSENCSKKVWKVGQACEVTNTKPVIIRSLQSHKSMIYIYKREWVSVSKTHVSICSWISVITLPNTCTFQEISGSFTVKLGVFKAKIWDIREMLYMERSPFLLLDRLSC